MKQQAVIPDPAAAENPIRERILGAAFKAFTEDGYAGSSTLDIARRAKISKRDLYAHFGSKQQMLAACIKGRADRMRLPPDLPAPRSRQMLGSTLTAFATKWLREISDPPVIATFRLAIAEATRSPEIARALDTAGRNPIRGVLAELLSNAQSARLIGAGEPTQMARQFHGLVWDDLMVGLLLGVAKRPGLAEAEQRAAKAAAAFMRLHPNPGTADTGRRRPPSSAADQMHGR